MLKTTKQIVVDGITYQIQITQLTADKCKCGCGKDTEGRKLYTNDACRQRACRARKIDKLSTKIINKALELKK